VHLSVFAFIGFEEVKILCHELRVSFIEEWRSGFTSLRSESVTSGGFYKVITIYYGRNPMIHTHWFVNGEKNWNVGGRVLMHILGSKQKRTG